MNTSDHSHGEQRWFRVWVDGRLTERFSDGLPDVAQEDGSDGSILIGRFVDMAHLRSMIDYLLGLGIDILRFEVDPPHLDEATRPIHSR